MHLESRIAGLIAIVASSPLFINCHLLTHSQRPFHFTFPSHFARSSVSRACLFSSSIEEHESSKHPRGTNNMSKRTRIEEDDIGDNPKRAAGKKTVAAGRKKAATIREDSPGLALPDMPKWFNSSRMRLLTKRNDQLSKGGDCVMLWMSRDQRVFDNYALLYAQGIAASQNVPLKVVFNLVPSFLEATSRQFGFMIRGLKEVESQLRSLNIPMYLLMGDPVVNIPRFAEEERAAIVVVDFSPLRVGQAWVKAVASSLDTSSSTTAPLLQVDAHNIVPCWEASPKLEYGARTIRPKIQSKLPYYLEHFPEPSHNPPGSLNGCSPIDWDSAFASLKINREVTEVGWLEPGPTAALSAMHDFINSPRLKNFGEKRNDPNEDALSNLSPYLHFGQLSAQRVVLEIKESKKYPASADVFIEEAVVRRELADNFCFYNPHYDSLEGCYEWAKETLRTHASDERAYIYSLEQLENARTHDDLWNASQLQMTSTGKMHGFLRMYWAKKILEWTRSPEEALRTAIYLNDKYQLDGRDPNGYVGCMWSIGGIHDQGWGERSVFGKIRFMNYEGCKRKFNVAKFVAQYPPAAANAAAASVSKTSSNGKKKEGK